MKLMSLVEAVKRVMKMEGDTRSVGDFLRAKSIEAVKRLRGVPCSEQGEICSGDGYYVDDTCHGAGLQPDQCVVVCHCDHLMKTSDPSDASQQTYTCPSCGSSIEI